MLDSLARAPEQHERPDACIVDPPRAGLHPKVARFVAGLDLPRLVYVSCNVRAAARDLQVLAEGGFQLERVRPLDLFPHTPHVESVLTLVAKAR